MGRLRLAVERAGGREEMVRGYVVRTTPSSARFVAPDGDVMGSVKKVLLKLGLTTPAPAAPRPSSTSTSTNTKRPGAAAGRKRSRADDATTPVKEETTAATKNPPKKRWKDAMMERTPPDLVDLVNAYVDKGFVVFRNAASVETVRMLLDGSDEEAATAPNHANGTAGPGPGPGGRALRPRKAGQVWRGARKTLEANVISQGSLQTVTGPLTMRQAGRFDIPIAATARDVLGEELESKGLLRFLRAVCPRGKFRTQNVLVSRPGSEQQRVHTDSVWDVSHAAKNPAPHYLTVLIPLTKPTAETGGTRVWPHSHSDFEWPLLNEAAVGNPPDAQVKKGQFVDIVSPLLDVGDALVFDGLLSHCGMANRSHADRFFYYAAFCTGHDPNTDVTGV